MSPEQKASLEYWIAGAKEALDTAQTLYQAEKYHHALFFCHLALEKALKARYVARKGTQPPYIHDLRRLADLSEASLDASGRESLASINTFNVAGRYEDEKLDLYKRATRTETQQWLETSTRLVELCLP